MLKLDIDDLLIAEFMIKEWGLGWFREFLKQYEEPFVSWGKLMRDFKDWLVKQDF